MLPDRTIMTATHIPNHPKGRSIQPLKKSSNRTSLQNLVDVAEIKNGFYRPIKCFHSDKAPQEIKGVYKEVYMPVSDG
jgi:hypothetical protein